jgi:serine/threonine protein kinase
MAQCPQCASDVEDASESCFNCGHVLRAPQQTLKRGSVVAERYEIQALLGRGGMGMVYKARDHKLEETVAIKVLRPEIASDPEMERRFRSEIRLARRVRHRNVCGIHEYGEDGSLRFIAMEFIEGVDLRKVLSEAGGLPLDQAFEYCIRTAEGLEAIHEAGIIHRDLKTANLMVDARGVVRLMDFGIAKQQGGEGTGTTATGMVVGTPEYMSPEQARGEKVDSRSDIYALGILAYEIFTGRVPFQGDTPLAIIFKHLQEPPPLEGPAAAALPPAVIPVLRKALAKEAVGRYATALEFAQSMIEARDATGISPLTPGPYTPLPVSLPTLAIDAVTDRPTSAPHAETRVLSGDEPATRVLASSARPRGKAVWIGVAAAALLATAVWTWSRREEPLPLPSPSPSALPMPVAVVPAAGMGTLVIDALPWGEVVEVTNAKGEAQVLPSSRFTPLALVLPPGDYQVSVRAGSGAPRSVPVSIRAAAVETRLVKFAPIEAADYLRRMGL